METLRRGATGTEVTRLQTRLKERGFDPGNIDGGFGGGTEAAVLAFQKSEGLPPTGLPSYETVRHLDLSLDSIFHTISHPRDPTARSSE